MVRFAFILFATYFSISSLAQAPTGLSTQSKKAIEFYTEADNHRVRREFAAAIELLNKAIDKDPKFVDAYYSLGLTYGTMKQYTNAIKQYEKGLALTNDINKQKRF